MTRKNAGSTSYDGDLEQLYRELYSTLEAESKDADGLSRHLDALREQKVDELSDREVFEHIIASVFSSGFAWDKYKQFESRLFEEFADFERTARYDESDVERLLSDDSIIRYERKIRAMIENAQNFERIVESYGSFSAYLSSFADSDRALQAVQNEFVYLGPDTAREFLKEIGYAHFVKLDRHLERVPERIGLVDDGTQRDAVVDILKQMAEEVDESLSVVDRVFWLHGAGLKDIGLQPVCGKVPECDRCRVTDCQYHQSLNVGQ